MTTNDYGFVKLNRKILSWGWYTNPNVFRVFIHCLLKANYTDKEWQGIVIPAGSFVTSYASLAKELKIPNSSIRRAIKKLISTQEVACKSTPQYTIISVKKYKLYQQIGTQNEKQTAHKWRTNGVQTAPTNNIKNKRKKEYYDNIKQIFENLNTGGAKE